MDKKSFEKNGFRKLGLEPLEDRKMLSILGDIAGLYNQYVAPVVQQVETFVAPVVKVAENVTVAAYQQVIQPVVDIVLQNTTHYSSPSQTSSTHNVTAPSSHNSGSSSSSNSKPSANLSTLAVDAVLAAGNIATSATNAAINDIVKPVASATSKAVASVTSVAKDVVFGAYDSIKNMATGVGSLVVDAASVTPIGFVINPDGAVKTVDKWGHVISTIAANPGKLADAVIGQYKQEYSKNKIGGVIGFAIPDAVLFALSFGAGGAAVEGADVAAEASKAAEVAADASKAEKFTLLEADLNAGSFANLRTISKGRNFVLDGVSIKDLIGESTFIQPNTGNVAKIGGDIHTTIDLVDQEAHLTYQLPKKILPRINELADGSTKFTKELADGSKVVTRFASDGTKTVEKIAASSAKVTSKVVSGGTRIVSR